MDRLTIFNVFPQGLCGLGTSGKVINSIFVDSLLQEIIIGKLKYA